MNKKQEFNQFAKAGLEYAKEGSLPNDLPNTPQNDKPHHSVRLATWLTIGIAVVLLMALASMFA